MSGKKESNEAFVDCPNCYQQIRLTDAPIGKKIEFRCPNEDCNSSLTYTRLEHTPVEGDDNKRLFIKWSLISVGIVVLLFAFGVLNFTTSGCTLPVDIVLAGVCIFGSFGASLGATIAIAIIMALLGLIGKLLGVIFNK